MPEDPSDISSRSTQSLNLTSRRVPGRTDALVNPPERVGDYLIERELGRGGMGVVYLARDPSLDRKLAVKVLPSEWTTDHRRFEREARAAAKLNHPNIATVYEFGHDGCTWFIAMEYIEGVTLRKLIGHGQRLLLDDALDYAVQIAEGLRAAHRRHVVHRDLKPSNVMVTGGQVKILDFGLAKLLSVTHTPASSMGATTDLTGEHGLLGTLGYMSPEQVRRGRVDARTDLFTFGIVMYEMLTGVMPFQGESTADLLGAVLRDTPAPLFELNPAAPPELEEIISRCLQKDPDARFRSVRPLLADLHRAREVVASDVVPSIAVLPFSTRRPEAPQRPDTSNELDEFIDGLAEELITALSRVRRLRIASRRSSFAFKGHSEDVCAVGRRLRVHTVLNGTVAAQGQRLQVDARLTRVVDGRELWSGHYDRMLDDVFRTQEEIAHRITGGIEALLTGGPGRSGTVPEQIPP